MSSESPSDPIESLAKRAAVGFLEWTSAKLDEFITKLANKDLAFIEDSETIKLAKELRNTGEWDFFKKYVDDPQFKILFQMGLTLRRLDNEKKDVSSLTVKIKRKHDSKGLHIAYFVQNGLFTRYVAIMLEQVSGLDKLKLEIRAIFEDIDKKVSFITREPNEGFYNNKANEIVSKIQAHSPKIYIISSSKSAMVECDKVKDLVLASIEAYYVEKYEAPAYQKKIYFLMNELF